MTLNTCPEPERLGEFATGVVGEDTADSIMDHLEECRQCELTVDNLAIASDTLVEKLRKPAPIDEYADESACERLEPLVQAIAGQPRRKDSDQAEADLATTMVGQYRLVKKLGAGGMGTVYQAVHEKLEKVVAIKVLPQSRMQSPAAVARFEREMRAVGRLDHPNIVRATDAGEVDGSHFLVMELVDGVDLAAVADQQKVLRIADACELMRQAAVGLQEADHHGMVHRDIKPSNIMLARRRRQSPIVKLLDMGLALLANDSAEGDLTTEHQLMGTLDYMAPEQASGAHDVDIRADIYSLGATLYRLLCGRPPIGHSGAKTVMQKLAAIAAADAPDLSQLREDMPQELCQFVQRMLATNPEERPATPEEVIAALEPFCADADLQPLLESPAKSEASAGAAVGELSGSTIEPDQTFVPSESAETPRIGDPQALASGPVATDFVLKEPAASAVGLRGRRNKSARRTKAATSSSGGRGFITPTRLLTGFGGLIAVALAVFFFKTPHGTIVVEIDDPAIAVSVLSEEITITNNESGESIKLKPGPQQLSVERGALTFNTDQFELKSGETVTLSVRYVDGRVTVQNKTNGNQSIGSSSAVAASESAAGQVPLGSENEVDRLRKAVDWVLSLGGTVNCYTDANRTKPLMAAGDVTSTMALKLTFSTLPNGGINLLSDLPQIRSIDTRSGYGLTAADVAVLTSLPSLHEVLINLDEDLTRQDLTAILRIPTLGSLGFGEENTEGNRLKDNELLRLIAELAPQLRKLNLQGRDASFDDTGLTALNALESLEHLTLHGEHITDVGLGQMHLPSLSFLSVVYCPQINGSFLEHIDVPKLQRFIFYNGIENPENTRPESLQFFNRFPLMADVSLTSHPRVTGKSLAPVLQSNDVHQILVMGCGIDAVGLKIIAGAENLFSLNLSRCFKIDDNALATLTDLKNLRQLNLSGNPQLTDAAVEPLLELMPQFEILVVTGTSLTADGIHRLKKANPKARIFE